MTHTPGPWVASGMHILVDAHTVASAIGKTMKPGWDGPPDDLDYEQCCANACLIAAAPEMLEALEGLWLCCLQQHLKLKGKPIGVACGSCPACRAKAAVEKARGEYE